MNTLFLVATLILASHPTNVGGYYPVTVVEDDQEIRQAAGTKVDSTFVLTPREAEAPREVLARYLERELRYAKSSNYARMLRQALSYRNRYFWHCGGYVQHGKRNAVCSMVARFSSDENARSKHFPEIFDGGASVCRCHYSFRIDAIFWFECNGEA